MQFCTSQTMGWAVYCSYGTTYPPSYHSPCTRIQGNHDQDMHQGEAANVDDEFCSKPQAKNQ